MDNLRRMDKAQSTSPKQTYKGAEVTLMVVFLGFQREHCARRISIIL